MFETNVSQRAIHEILIKSPDITPVLCYPCLKFLVEHVMMPLILMALPMIGGLNIVCIVREVTLGTSATSVITVRPAHWLGSCHVAPVEDQTSPPFD